MNDNHYNERHTTIIERLPETYKTEASEKLENHVIPVPGTVSSGASVEFIQSGCPSEGGKHYVKTMQRRRREYALIVDKPLAYFKKGYGLLFDPYAMLQLGQPILIRHKKDEFCAIGYYTNATPHTLLYTDARGTMQNSCLLDIEFAHGFVGIIPPELLLLREQK